MEQKKINSKKNKRKKKNKDINEVVLAEVINLATTKHTEIESELEQILDICANRKKYV